MLNIVKKSAQVCMQLALEAKGRGASRLRQISHKLASLVLIPGILFFGLNESRAQAVACVAGETLQTFSFPATWTNGTTGPYSYTVGAGVTAVILTFTIVGAQPFSGGSPTQGILGNIANTVRAQHTVTGANVLLSTQNVAFDRSINKLRFISADVDSQVFQDAIRTRVNGSVIPTLMTPVTPANITVNAGTGTATANYNGSQCATNSAACNVTSDFNTTGITSASQAFLTGPSHANATQFVGWNSFSWCLPTRADIQLTKTDGRTSVQTGDTTTYTVAMSNNGPSLADGLILQDAAAAGLTKTGTITCTYGGGAVGPANPTIAQMEAGFAIPTLPSGGTVSCSVSALVN